MTNFLDNIYGILFAPKATIEKLIEEKPLWQAFAVLGIITLASAILNSLDGFSSVYDVLFFFGNILVISLSSLIILFSLVGFFELTARIFSDESKFKATVCAFSFSLLPWVFTAPLLLLKINLPLIITSTILEVVVWAWSVVLIFLSVKTVYNLSTRKTWMFFAVPLLGTIVAINWVSQLVAIVTGMF